MMMEMRWYKLDGKASPLSPPHSDQAASSSSVVHDRYHITSTFELTDPASTMLFHNSTTSSSSSSSSNSNNEHTLYYVTKLTIRQVERADSGSYLCTAQNRYGFVRKNFSIVALEPPDRPPEVRTDSVTSSSLKISWAAPYDGNSPITEYVVAYRALAATVPITVSVAVSSFGGDASSSSASNFVKTANSGSLTGKKSWITYQLTDLVPFTAYYIQIKAKNAIGYSQFSEAISVKTAEEREFLGVRLLDYFHANFILNIFSSQRDSHRREHPPAKHSVVEDLLATTSLLECHLKVSRQVSELGCQKWLHSAHHWLLHWLSAKH